MRRTAKPYLHDIVVSGRDVFALVDGKSFDEYMKDTMLQAAVERKFIALGEALYQMRHWFPRMIADIPGSRALIAFRHSLVHGYDQVSDDLTWGVIQTRLKPVLSAAEKMLAS